MENEPKNIKTKSKLLIPVIILVGIIFLGLGTWAGYNHWNKLKNPQQPAGEQQSAQEQQKNEFEDWQTYRNEEYGFEFKYPQNFKITKDEIKIIYTGGQKWYQLELIDLFSVGTPLMSFEVNPDGYGPFFPDKRYEIEELTDGGIQIVNVLPEEKSENSNDGYILILSNSLVTKNGNEYFFSFIFKEGSKNWEPIFRQILSTFKFFEPANTSSWKTYKNNRFGYELKYPNDWFAGIMQWSPGGGYVDIPDDFTEYITFSSRDLLLDENQLYGGKYQSLSDYLVNGKIQTITIRRENGQAFIQNSNTVDDFWNKLGKADIKTGRIINQFIKKRIIDNVEFIIFNQPEKPRALFLYKNNFFRIESDGINLDKFDQVLSTFKFFEPTGSVLEKISFGRYTAYIKKENDKNYLILSDNEKEIIIKEGELFDSVKDNYSTMEEFKNLNFSPKGNYLIYEIIGYEGSINVIYNLKTKQEVDIDLICVDNFDFTQDEENFYNCSSAGMCSGPMGRIYTVPGFDLEYSVVENEQDPNPEFLNAECKYDKTLDAIIFTLSDFVLSSAKTEEVRYYLGTKTIEIIEK